jgi:hypothetical protein
MLKGGWSCLELKTGKKMWNDSGVGKGSLCFADGMLFLFGEDRGKAGLSEASPKTPRGVIWWPTGGHPASLRRSSTCRIVGIQQPSGGPPATQIPFTDEHRRSS